MFRACSAIVVLASLAACGDGGKKEARTGDEAAPAPSACDLASADDVTAVFGPTRGEGKSGAPRSCTYEVRDIPGMIVTVFLYSTKGASDFAGIRSGFEDNRGGTTDVPGVGDAAFQPNDVGDTEIVVRSGDLVFSVTVMGGVAAAPPDLGRKVRDLAERVADKRR